MLLFDEVVQNNHLEGIDWNERILNGVLSYYYNYVACNTEVDAFLVPYREVDKLGEKWKELVDYFDVAMEVEIQVVEEEVGVLVLELLELWVPSHYSPWLASCVEIEFL